MTPIVAVITPTKNRQKLLCEVMDSVHKQTFNNWEHIIVDDGSNDGTAEEVRRRALNDPRIRYIERNGERSGANVCRNLGIAQSRSELILFLDSDDLLRPQCLERRVEIMQRNPDLNFAVFRASVFTNSVGDLQRLYHPQNPGDDLLRFLTLECPWEISGPIWRRSFLNSIGRFDETLLSMQDLEMHARAISARGKYIYYQDVDHDIRWQNDSSKTSVRHFYDPSYIEAAEEVRLKLLNTIQRSGMLTWSRQRALTGLCFGTAESWVRLGHVSKGVRGWNRGCGQHNVHWPLRMIGMLMLGVALLIRGENGFCFRLLNKWKGWVRFRQESALLEQDCKLSTITNDCEC